VETLLINEIFYSIQGEGSRSGLPCVFIRTQGCGLRCRWCDTGYALEHDGEGERMSLTEIRERISGFPTRFVEITGGEPLEQEASFPLMKQLCDDGYTVALETGGHVDVAKVDPRVIKILDIKCPGSGVAERMRWSNLVCLHPHDEVKFVVADESDYRYAADTIRQHDLPHRVSSIFISPVHGAINLETLAGWMLEDGLPARLHIQLHKLIWGPDRRGV